MIWEINAEFGLMFYLIIWRSWRNVGPVVRESLGSLTFFLNHFLGDLIIEIQCFFFEGVVRFVHHEAAPALKAILKVPNNHLPSQTSIFPENPQLADLVWCHIVFAGSKINLSGYKVKLSDYLTEIFDPVRVEIFFRCIILSTRRSGVIRCRS